MEKQRLKLYKSKKVWVTAALALAVAMLPTPQQTLGANDNVPTLASEQEDANAVEPEPEVLVAEGHDDREAPATVTTVHDDQLIRSGGHFTFSTGANGAGPLLKNQRVRLSGAGYPSLDFYLDHDGKSISGFYTNPANGKTYCAPGFGVLAQDSAGFYMKGNRYCFNANGELVRNQYCNDGMSYADEDGKWAIGPKLIDGKWAYFDQYGNLDRTHHNYQNTYFSTDSGATWYYADNNGNLVTGMQTINNAQRYFAADGKQIKNQFHTINGVSSYINSNGDVVTNDFFTPDHGTWYYADATGQIVTNQFKTINGQTYYFSAQGVQVKGQTLVVNGKSCTFSATNGALVK